MKFVVSSGELNNFLEISCEISSFFWFLFRVRWKDNWVVRCYWLGVNEVVPTDFSTVLVARLPSLALMAGSLRSGSALIDRLYPPFLALGSAEIDRLIPGCGATRGPAGDFRLVDILTLVWPEVVALAAGALDRLVGEGEGLDLLGVDEDLELVLGAANLE